MNTFKKAIVQNKTRLRSNSKSFKEQKNDLNDSKNERTHFLISPDDHLKDVEHNHFFRIVFQYEIKDQPFVEFVAIKRNNLRFQFPITMNRQLVLI
jgi:hypothetical protein